MKSGLLVWPHLWIFGNSLFSKNWPYFCGLIHIQENLTPIKKLFHPNNLFSKNLYSVGCATSASSAEKHQVMKGGGLHPFMALPVMELQDQGYKIRKIFA